MKKQRMIGAWITGGGRLLFVAILVLCLWDLFGLTERDGLMVPLSGYLTGIAIGVVMQFVGAAVPNMRFANVIYDESVGG